MVDEAQIQTSAIDFSSRKDSRITEPEENKLKLTTKEKRQRYKRSPSQTSIELKKIGERVFTVLLPEDQKSSIVYRPDYVLKHIIEKICDNRNINIKSFVPRHLDGSRIPWSCTLKELLEEEITFNTPASPRTNGTEEDASDSSSGSFEIISNSDSLVVL